jgi:hypothetical protein
VPPSVRLGLFLFVFVFFIWSSIIILNFFFMLRIFESFEFFFMPPALFGHLRWLRILFYAPLCCLGTFNHCFFLSHLPPVWGVILAKVIPKKNFIMLKRGLQRIYFSLVKRLSKMTFLHSKLMHLGSVSLAFMRVCKMISHYSFK